MIHQATAYLKFIRRSKNQHGIHSPFVYQLITQCFYDKKKRKAYQLWRQAKKRLLDDKSIIEVEDFGAGSKVFKSDQRQVKQIAARVGTSFKRAKLLNRVVSYLKCETALELGTSLGLGSLAICLDNPVHLTSLEACPNTLDRAQQLFEELGCQEQIKTVKTDFQSYLDQLSSDQNFDLVFIDGHHSYAATISYFKQLLKHKHNDSVFIFDDIHWSKGMEKAWEEICQSEEVKVSLDTFQWGFVFFRKEQAKEHFRIRV
ncbi:MAG: class I SAM-dependent methyltransferase [Psychroflexus sp.]|nr:class I SAM-dependent methyltransferase [Psychroflexus sp.]MDN6310479.1 class I SAM-dependent methyltransferase [Psychroflexus sp.]